MQHTIVGPISRGPFVRGRLPSRSPLYAQCLLYQSYQILLSREASLKTPLSYTIWRRIAISFTNISQENFSLDDGPGSPIKKEQPRLPRRGRGRSCLRPAPQPPPQPAEPPLLPVILRHPPQGAIIPHNDQQLPGPCHPGIQNPSDHQRRRSRKRD